MLVHRVLTCALGLLIAATSSAQDVAGLADGTPPAGRGAMAPNLSVGADGASIICSWLEPVHAADGAPHRRNWQLRISRFDGTSWSTSRVVVERSDLFVNWADVPLVVESRGDSPSLIAAWLQKSAAATFAYDIQLARSMDDGTTWSMLGKLNDDDVKGEHGFVSMVALHDDTIRAFWLDGREMNPEAAHGDVHADAGNMTIRTTIIDGETVRPSVRIDDRSCECCNTDAALTSNGPIFVYRDRSEDETRDNFIIRADAERGWTSPAPVYADGWVFPGCPVNGPAIDARGNEVACAWFTAADNESAVRLAFSRDSGANFGRMIPVAGFDSLGRVDVVLIDPSTAVVCWLGATDWNAGVFLARVGDDGTVGQRVLLGETSPGRETGFPRMKRLDDDRLLVVWTEADDDGRRLRGKLVPLAKLPG